MKMGVDPVTLAIIGSSVAATGQYLGAKEQSKAFKRASATEAGFKQQILDLFGLGIEELAPFRETAARTLPVLEEEALREPGAGEIFQRGLGRGIEGIREQLGRVGLADSSVASRAIGEFTTGAIGQDINRITGLRQSLLGGAGAGLPSTQSLLGLLGGSAGRSQQLQLGAGGTQAGLFGALGDIGSQAAFLPLLLGQQQQPNLGVRQSTSGLGAGIDPFA
jgi:hypothetical protein